MKTLVLVGTLSVLLAILALLLVPTGCGDDNCLEEWENCTSAYVEREYGDGRTCCSGMVCKPEPVNFVNACQW